jgi:uncharacterized protein YacL
MAQSNRSKKANNRFQFKIEAPETPTQYVYEIGRILIAFIFGILGFTLSHFLLFLEIPLMGINYMGEVVIGVVFFALVYYFIPFVLKAVGDAVKTIVTQQLYENINLFYAGNNRSGKKQKVEKFSVSPLVVDTSVVIDGRLCAMVAHGFVSSQLVIPQFVLYELQDLADSKSKKTRDKGRRGLQLLEDLKKSAKRSLIIYNTKKSKDVDKSLIRLTKKLKGRLATVDFNLDKVARVAGLKVYNINALADIVKVNVIPGDILTLEVKKKGVNKKQGVAYLQDGTMVVIKNGDMDINKFINVEVTKVLQKPSGVMVFATKVK